MTDEILAKRPRGRPRGGRNHPALRRYWRQLKEKAKNKNKEKEEIC